MTAYEFVNRCLGGEIILAENINRKLENPQFREDIYAVIHKQPGMAYKPLLDILFEKEIQYRRDDSSDEEFFENLYWCAFLLYQVGDVRDVEKMWAAKHIDMDTACGFDIQFLLGAGFQATVDYLQSWPFSEASAVLDYITNCKKSGDFENMDEWENNRYEYFTE